jgi:two-component system nitrate/nitrite response regulator NarL
MLIAAGLSNKEIARRIKISEGTVKIHLHNVYTKLGVANRTSLATVAQRHWGDGS